MLLMSFDVIWCYLMPAFFIVTWLPTEVAGVNCKRLLIHFHSHAVHSHSSIPRKDKPTKVNKIDFCRKTSRNPKVTRLDKPMNSIENIEISRFFSAFLSLWSLFLRRMVIAKLIRSYEADIPPIRGESVSNFTPGEWISSREKFLSLLRWKVVLQLFHCDQNVTQTWWFRCSPFTPLASRKIPCSIGKIWENHWNNFLGMPKHDQKMMSN